MSSFSPFQLDIFKEAHLGCATNYNFVDQVFAMNFFPFILLAAATLVFIVPKLLKAKRSELPQIEVQLVYLEFWKLSCYTLFLLYPVICAVNTRLWNCREIAGVYYLAVEMTVECWTEGSLLFCF